MGYGTTAGICPVCSYERSDDVAYESDMDAELARHAPE